MLDAIVQLLRNALCCVKDLGWYQDTFIWDPTITATYLYADLPEPLNKTTPLEVIISISQFYAVVQLVYAGLSMMLKNIFKLQRVQSAIGLYSEQNKDVKKKDNKDSMTTVDILIRDSLTKELNASSRLTMIGFFVFFLGLSFIWLTANSWHITETDWIGGLQGLIHALTVAEIALVVLLYYMYDDANQCFVRSEIMEELADKMRLGNVRLKDLSLTSFEVASHWEPFWNSSDKKDSVEKLMAEEKIHLQKEVSWFIFETDTKKKKTDQEEKNNDKIRGEQLESMAYELYNSAKITRMEGYREYVYFVLNLIAFYGYLLGIIVYYYHKEDEHPYYVRQAVLGLSNDDAEWHGNFAGDLMWTIEPIVILLTPVWFNAIRPKPTMKKNKPKID